MHEQEHNVFPRDDNNAFVTLPSFLQEIKKKQYQKEKHVHSYIDAHTDTRHCTHSASASSMEWVVKDTLRCRAAAAITRHSRRLATGSIPVEGSSSSKTCVNLRTCKM
jgi:hypothetical protein